MPREFPTSLELLQQYVEMRSDIRTPEGRAGYRQILDHIRDLVQKWSLGDAKIHEFEGGGERNKGEPMPANLTIEVGSDDPEETGIWYAHADVIHANDVYPAGRNPYHLRKVNEEGIYEGCGSLDMKAGLVGELQALHGIEEKLIEARRRIIMLIVYGEEEDSCGVNHARPVIRKADWAISTEISVDSTLGENGHLLYARPGRARFDVEIDGLESSHMGGLKKLKHRNLAKSRLIRASNAIDHITLPGSIPRPEDNSTPEQICYANEIGVYPAQSYSVTDRAWMNVEVTYNDPKLELTEIESILRRRLEKTLSRGFTIELQRDRVQPWIKPWHENTDHPLVLNGVQELQHLVNRKPVLRWGNPTAEEGIFADERVPIITLPPDGEGEHKSAEKVSLPYLDNVMTPFLRNMAISPNRLTHQNDKPSKK